MTATHGLDERNLIPRWRRFGDAVRSGELDALPSVDGRHKEPTPNQDLHEAVSAFTARPGLHTASDLVTQAAVANSRHEVALKAARKILDGRASKPLRELSSLLLSNPDQGQPSIDNIPAEFDRNETIARAAKLKAVVRSEPRNAIRWTDLALAHLNLGAASKAERNIRTAVSLEPLNRFVLRSAVRLYVLIDEPETAHHLLTRDVRALNDPWLRAAALATATLIGKPPSNIRASRQILESGRHPAWHLSELAGQLATLELNSGQLRKAKRTMRTALIDPTENAVAQAEWASQHGVDALGKIDLERPHSFEARALAYRQSGKFAEGIRAGLHWQADQPFDPSPAVFVSYLASVATQDYYLGELAAKQGLIANQHHGLLRNNLVFALANQGKVAEAREQLEHILRPALGLREASTLVATKGLVAFRGGDPITGRRLYAQAVDELVALNDRDVAALAAVFWAREELLLGSHEAATAIVRALELSQRSPSQEVHLWRDRLMQMAAQNVTLATPPTLTPLEP